MHFFLIVPKIFSTFPAYFVRVPRPLARDLGVHVTWNARDLGVHI